MLDPTIVVKPIDAAAIRKEREHLRWVLTDLRRQQVSLAAAFDRKTVCLLAG
jgi:hypothetical protein